MAYYAIGDIHGCLDELKAALGHVGRSGGGRLVLLGGRLNVLAWDGTQGYRQWDGGWKKITGRCSRRS